MFFVGIAVSVLLAEIVSVLFLFQLEGWIQAGLLHAITIFILAGWTYALKGRDESRFAEPLLVLTAATGLFGVAICLLAAAVYATRARKAASPSEWISEFFTDAHDADDHVGQRIILGLDDLSSQSGVEPFRDIMTGGTVLQKQMAIAKIMRHFRPQFAPLLLEAVQDDNPAVRVQAASALAKIEHDFMTQYMRIEKSLKNVPMEDENWLPLARLCDDYARAGLLDDESRKTLAAKAIAIYEAYLADHNDEEINVRLGCLYLRENQPDKTCQILSEQLEKGAASPVAVLGYLEALFRMKKMKQVRDLARRYQDVLKRIDGANLMPEAETVRIWSLAATPAQLKRHYG